MKYHIDAKVLRDLQLAPLDFDDEGEEDGSDGNEEAPELHRLAKRNVGGLDLLDLFVKAGESKDDGGKVTTDFIASTASIDRMGDVVEQSWRLAAWRKNPVILYEHSAPVVGRGVARTPRPTEEGGGNLTIKVQWDIGDHNPIGTLAGMQHLNGFRSAGSVGFMPGKIKSRLDLEEGDPRKAPKDTPRWRAGHVFSHNELLEFSSVAVPANREAVQLSAYAQDTDDTEEQIRRFVEESTATKTAEAILDAIKADDVVRRAILALVWGGSVDKAVEPVEPVEPRPLAYLFED